MQTISVDEDETVWIQAKDLCPGDVVTYFDGTREEVIRVVTNGYQLRYWARLEIEETGELWDKYEYQRTQSPRRWVLVER